MDRAERLGENQQAALKRMRFLANLFDDRFRLPVIGSRFGFDGVLGLVPGVGDAATSLVSLYLAAEGWRFGMSFMRILRMGFNVVIDMIFGTVPLLGDVFDFAWRANRKNVRLVLAHLEENKEASRMGSD